MYLPNINYFVYELADNSVDVYMDGYGDLIIISIDEQDKVSVRDYGPGLPVIPSEQFPDILEGELCMGNLKAGTKFTKDNKRKSAGLNGVGASCVNCLSKTFDVEVYKDGKLYTMSFEEGLVKKHLSCDGNTKEATGTYIECVPDRAIWEKLDNFDINQINSRMKQLAYLNPGLTIELNIDYEGHEVHEKYYFPEGVKTYVEELAKNKDELTDIWYDIKTVDVEPNRPMDIYMALMYTDTYSDTIYAYTNNVLNTNQSSSHITGFKSELSSAIKSYYDNISTNKNKKNIIAEDTRLGIIAIISIKVADPHYIGQGKDQLDEKAIRSAIYRETEEFVLDQLDKNPNEAKIILNKVLES
jgi:DNA gyrase subunit B